MDKYKDVNVDKIANIYFKNVISRNIFERWF